MSILIRSLTIILLLVASFAYSNPNQETVTTQQGSEVNWNELQHVFTDLILQGEWISEISARQNITNSMTEIGISSVGVSCSSRDGSKDCFCPGGCWRSETDCGCD
ncbi:hypothetical protein [uncultured Shewanella sp.]|uniref:hypothetical protein n=1 Tax=uncultured Shewanella sp. TaxID=173975 RepID=UPI002610F86D|nr:hypothetical protein [uncultured Shewanella sp.]